MNGMIPAAHSFGIERSPLSTLKKKTKHQVGTNSHMICIEVAEIFGSLLREESIRELKMSEIGQRWQVMWNGA